MAWSAPISKSTGDLVSASDWNTNTVDNPNALLPSGWTVLIDGGGAAITTGIKMDLEIPYKCDLNTVTLLADQSGSIVIDIWKDTYANYPPTDADTITGGAEPTITAATKSQDATLSGWTTAQAEGDLWRINVDSITTCTRVSMCVRADRS